MLSHFNTILECGQTDGQTDGRTELLYQYRARISIATTMKSRVYTIESSVRAVFCLLSISVVSELMQFLCTVCRDVPWFAMTSGACRPVPTQGSSTKRPSATSAYSSRLNSQVTQYFAISYVYLNLARGRPGSWNRTIKWWIFFKQMR